MVARLIWYCFVFVYATCVMNDRNESYFRLVVESYVWMCRTHHGNGNVAIVMKFSSQAVLEVAILTTSCAADDENVFKMTTFFVSVNVMRSQWQALRSTLISFTMWRIKGKVWRRSGWPQTDVFMSGCKLIIAEWSSCWLLDCDWKRWRLSNRHP